MCKRATVFAVASVMAALIATAATASIRSGSADPPVGDDPCGGWVAVIPPEVTGDAVVGGTLTTTNGWWGREFCPSLPPPGQKDFGEYTYQWLRDDEPIAGATSKSFVVTEEEAGTLVSVLVTMVDPGTGPPARSNEVGIAPGVDEVPGDDDSAEAPAFSDVDPTWSEVPGPVDSDDPGSPDGQFLAAAATQGVATSGNADMFRFTNADGTWTIFKRCFDVQTPPTPTTEGKRRNAGPGYIVRFEKVTTETVYVNDYVERTNDPTPGYINSVNGGLGTFGWHNTRGAINQTPGGDDPTTSAVETKVDRAFPGYAIEGRMCAPKNEGFGVFARNWSGPTRVGPDRIDLDFNVFLRDAVGNTGEGTNDNAIVRVRYRYSFLKTAVKVWIGVTAYPRNDSGGIQFVKEPKLAVGVVGGAYKRVSVFNGPDGKHFVKGIVEGHPKRPNVALSTDHSAADDRVRARWDYGTSATAEGTAPCSGGACFNVVMMAFPTPNDGNIQRTCTGCPTPILPSRWENDAGLGLDNWSVLATARNQTWPRDTRGGGNEGESIVAWCGVPIDLSKYDTNGNGSIDDVERSRASQDATPELDGNRVWEFGGWKETPSSPFSASVGLFHAWTGGRGQSDCEPLERTWFTGRQSFGTFAIYSLNSGWEQLR